MYQNNTQLKKTLTKVWDRLIRPNYDDEAKKRNGKKNCTNLKQTSTKCGAALCGV